jgi:DNA invertase Pin-like site-specific DNA recombinase
MRVGYARTSTAQEEQDTSIDGQVAQLEAAGCERVIAERRSAFKGARPGWDELWALVGRGAVTEVLVVDQSRLSRSGDDRQFLELCASKGTKVRTVIGGEIETQTDAGFLTASMMSVMNELQSRITAAKVRDGLRRRREAGFYACGKVPFGYRYNGEQVEPSPDHWEAARVMWDQLVARQMNIAGWIKATGMPWTPRGVRQWIANPILRGIVREKHGAVEALISWQEWSAAEEMLKVRSVMRGRTAHVTHLFTGLVKCDQCGKSLHNVRDRAVARLKCKSRHCDWYGRGIRVSQVREQVIAALVQAADAMAATADLPDKEPVEAGVIRDRIAKAKAALAAGVPLQDGAIDQMEAQLAALLRVNVSPRFDEYRDLFADPATLELATDEELRAVVIEFIGSIVWLGGLESLSITLR